jgi:lipoate-protein ligase A
MPEALFYQSFAGGSYYNMAFDEWLFSRALSRPGSAFLRLYTWQSGTITFGCNQRRQTALDFSRLGDTPVVRRVTGGRAIYHDSSELTYSLAVNGDGTKVGHLTGSLSETSRVIARALAAFLDRLGILTLEVEKSSTTDLQPDFFHKAPCFASAARNELMTDGRKIVASAQKRVGNSFLQHGSIKLRGIASHPALPGIGEQFGVLQPFDSEALKQFAVEFCATVSRAVGIPFRPRTLTATDAKELARGTAYVAKNALSKRVIVAQNQKAVSL